MTRAREPVKRKLIYLNVINCNLRYLWDVTWCWRCQRVGSYKVKVLLCVTLCVFWHRCPTRAYCTRPSIEIFLSITNINLNQYMIQSKMPSHVWNIRRVKPCPGKARRAEQNILSSSSAPQGKSGFAGFRCYCWWKKSPTTTWDGAKTL